MYINLHAYEVLKVLYIVNWLTKLVPSYSIYLFGHVAPIYPNSNLHAQIFLPLFPFQTQINPTHAVKWNAVQGSVVRQARLHRPGYRVRWRLSICAGEVPYERGQFLQSSGWLLDLLRASQLPWPPVLPGEGQTTANQWSGVRPVPPCSLSVASLSDVPVSQYLSYLAVTHWSSSWNKVWLEIHSKAHLLLVCSLYVD